jgi:hypothetical protein
MALDNTLQSKYLTRSVVKQRNSVTLLGWADYTATEAIPSPADDAWVRLRVVAEAIPLALDFYTTQTLGYFLQDTATQSNILQFISEDNDSATEQTLATTNQTICDTFMPRYALTTVTQQQIDDWRTKNNAPAPGKDKP